MGRMITLLRKGMTMMTIAMTETREGGGEGGGNGEDEEGGGKEVYQKQERDEGEQPEQANRTSGGRQLIEVRESK
jgi:hypothetical protein